MERVLFSMFLLLIATNEPACRPGEKDDYRERIAGVVNYLDKEHRFSTKDCITLFLLQSDKCNICTISNLEAMRVDSGTRGKVVFLLSGMNDSVFHFVDSSFRDKQILVDKNQQLGRYGLSFMRNLRVNICDEEVESYGFY